MSNILKKPKRHCLKLFTIALLTIGGCSRSNIQKGEECLRIGDFENARSFFENAVKKNPASSAARYGLARSWYQKCQYLENEGLENEKDLRDAIRNLEYASNLGFRDSLYTHLSYTIFRLSKIFLEKKDTTIALQLAEKAVRINQKNTDILNYAGILHYKNGNQKNAEDYFIIASQLDTADATGLFNLGMIAWHDKDYKFAHQLWFEALKRAPDNETIIHWFAESEVLLMESE